MSTQTGKEAENAVAEYLQRKFTFEILAQNWRNRFCEIDIVARKDDAIHFIEVKYRKNSSYGSGLDYVTSKKALQLRKAALNWVLENEWEGDIQIDVASVDGQTGHIEFIENAVQA